MLVLQQTWPFMHPCTPRLKRLARGERELAQSDLQMVPELAGNPFLPRLFQLHDSNSDGYMDASDLLALLEVLARLGDEDARHECKPCSALKLCRCLC